MRAGRSEKGLRRVRGTVVRRPLDNFGALWHRSSPKPRLTFPWARPFDPNFVAVRGPDQKQKLRLGYFPFKNARGSASTIRPPPEATAVGSSGTTLISVGLGMCGVSAWSGIAATRS
ncbi:hypothetical protein NL676_000033, partial [Syzygium grande]